MELCVSFPFGKLTICECCYLVTRCFLLFASFNERFHDHCWWKYKSANVFQIVHCLFGGVSNRTELCFTWKKSWPVSQWRNIEKSGIINSNPNFLFHMIQSSLLLYSVQQPSVVSPFHPVQIGYSIQSKAATTTRLMPHSTPYMRYHADHMVTKRSSFRTCWSVKTTTFALTGNHMTKIVPMDTYSTLMWWNVRTPDAVCSTTSRFAQPAAFICHMCTNVVISSTVIHLKWIQYFSLVCQANCSINNRCDVFRRVKPFAEIHQVTMAWKNGQANKQWCKHNFHFMCAWIEFYQLGLNKIKRIARKKNCFIYSQRLSYRTTEGFIASHMTWPNWLVLSCIPNHCVDRLLFRRQLIGQLRWYPSLEVFVCRPFDREFSPLHTIAAWNVASNHS